METNYKYFLSIKNICPTCGYGHELFRATPIIVMEEDDDGDYKYGAWCRKCHASMDPTFIEPSITKFTKKELED